MEDYTNQINENSGQRGGGFLYASQVANYGRGGGVSGNQQMQINTFHLQSGSVADRCFQSESQAPTHPIVKTEAATSLLQKFHNYHLTPSRGGGVHHHQQETLQVVNSQVDAIKAKIISHPQYSNLLQAYMDCQKVGAPPEVVSRLAAVRQEFETRQRSSMSSKDSSKDPELDQFMEAYSDMLVKYREELTRPVQEAVDFMRRIESQLNILSTGPVLIFNSVIP